MATSFEIIESGPLSVTFLVTNPDAAVSQIFKAHNAWNLLPQGPLKDLLSAVYLDDGIPSPTVFLRAAGAAGMKTSAMPLGDQSEPTVIWGLNTMIDPDPDGTPFCSVATTGNSVTLHIEVMHSITK